jgi:hypothetical protein
MPNTIRRSRQRRIYDPSAADSRALAGGALAFDRMCFFVWGLSGLIEARV